MAKLVFGSNLSPDGYVDHLATSRSQPKRVVSQSVGSNAALVAGDIEAARIGSSGPEAVVSAVGRNIGGPPVTTRTNPS